MGALLLLIVIFLILIGLIAKNFFNKKKEEGFSNLLLVTGFSLITTSFGTVFDKVITLVAIFRAKRDEVGNIITNSDGINFIQLSIGFFIILVFFGMKYYNQNKKYILNIKGYDFSKNVENHHKDIGLSSFEFKERDVDFSSIFKNESDDIIKNNIILEAIKKKILTFKMESKNFKRGYTGIAPIPYIMYAGTLLKRVKFSEYYEYNKLDGQKYYKLKPKKTYLIKHKFSDLELRTDIDKLDKSISEVVLTISITSLISEVDFSQFDEKKIIELAVNQPSDNKIVSKYQLENYYKKIYRTIIKLDSSLPYLNKVHLLYAGQSCLALEIGKIIEDTRMPEIINYHYSKQSSKRYSWGLVLNGKNKGKYINFKGEIANV